MINATESTSTRPYLIRALYEWCTDNSLTPYVAVQVDDSVQVPRDHVKNGEIVLNISFDATSSLSLGNEFIEFKARFAGTPREIKVPIDRVTAVYARENGQGMAFPAPSDKGARESGAAGTARSPAIAVAPRTPLPEEGKAPASSDARLMHLVTGDPSASKSTPASALDPEQSSPVTSGPIEPPRPPTGGGSRPALKRIK